MYADDQHLFPTYDRNTSDNIIPIASFIAKKIVTLKKSFMTSSDKNERNEIQSTLMFYQSALLLLTLSFFTEEQELIDLAKEIYRT